MKILAGPDYSLEFGWLLMSWIPAIRYMRRKAGKIVVACNRRHRYLYQDFANGYEDVKKRGKLDRWLIDGQEARMPQELKSKYSSYKIIKPNRKICMEAKKEYIQYGLFSPNFSKAIVFHVRCRKYYKSKSRNWPLDKYQKLAVALHERHHIKYSDMKSIGSKHDALHIPKTEDMRDVPVDFLCDLLRSARVCVGTSSGPLHLASLCSCPHVVITGAERQ